MHLQIRINANILVFHMFGIDIKVNCVCLVNYYINSFFLQSELNILDFLLLCCKSTFFIIYGTVSVISFINFVGKKLNTKWNGNTSFRYNSFKKKVYRFGHFLGIKPKKIEIV